MNWGKDPWPPSRAHRKARWHPCPPPALSELHAADSASRSAARYNYSQVSPWAQPGRATEGEEHRRREAMKQNRRDWLRVGWRRANQIIQLSHRQMMKKRHKKIFDNWTAIWELLVHRRRSADSVWPCSTRLSVTTVGVALSDSAAPCSVWPL